MSNPLARTLTAAEEFKAMTPEQVKIFEARLRRAAKRQGMIMRKSRTRDPRAIDYGTYRLLDENSGNVQLHDSRGNGVSLLAVEQFLFGDE
jgi:hypothetical protein